MANNETKAQGPLRIGVIAGPERLAELAPALAACKLLQPAGQAGMPQAAALPGVPWCDDPRVLIGNPELEAVLVAASTRQTPALVAVAAGRGLSIWQLPPLACNFAQAAEVLAQVRKAGVLYRVASWWEYVSEHVWAELHWPAEFKPLFSELRVSARGPAHDSWRSGVAETAGGALADAAYFMLEALIAVRGLPHAASGTIGQYRTTPSGAARAAEDTAVAILRYGDGGAALVRAAWDQPPFGQRLLHHGATATALLTNEEVALLDAHGDTLDRRPLPGGFLAHELMRFADAVRGQARDRAAAPLDRHLAVNALLEAVYLSARTGHPESPGKYYQVQGLPEPRP